MIGSVDRLPDWAWTEEQMNDMYEDIINPNRYDVKPKHICWYHLYKDDEYTGKAMVLAVESIVDGLDAVNSVVQDAGLTAQIGEFGNESILSNQVIHAIYMVLGKFTYEPKVKFSGSDKIFSYEPWMARLL